MKPIRTLPTLLALAAMLAAAPAFAQDSGVSRDDLRAERDARQQQYRDERDARKEQYREIRDERKD